MHYWRALKESKFNAAQCDPSTGGAAWLRAALRLSDMTRAPQHRLGGKEVVRGV